MACGSIASRSSCIFFTGIEVADLVTNGSAVAAVTISSLVTNSSQGNGDHIMASCEIGECPYGLHNDMQVRCQQLIVLKCNNKNYRHDRDVYHMYINYGQVERLENLREEQIFSGYYNRGSKIFS